MGMHFLILASRQSLTVRKRPLINFIPVSVLPFDWESYAAGSSLASWSRSLHSTLASSMARLTSAWVAFSPSALRMTRVWPSHNTS